jgi:hypothetical protein
MAELRLSFSENTVKYFVYIVYHSPVCCDIKKCCPQCLFIRVETTIRLGHPLSAGAIFIMRGGHSVSVGSSWSQGGHPLSAGAIFIVRGGHFLSVGATFMVLMGQLLKQVYFVCNMCKRPDCFYVDLCRPVWHRLLLPYV